MHPFSAILPALSIVTGPRISPLASLNLQANPLSLSSYSVVLLDPAFVDSPESRKPNDACEHITSADQLTASQFFALSESVGKKQ